MKYTAALLTFLLTACMNPNDAFFQNRRYQMLEAQLNGSNAIFHYGYSQNPDHDLLVDQVRVPDAYRASFERDWIAKEQGYRKNDCVLKKAESGGVTYYTCDAEKGFNGTRFVIYVVNIKNDKGYVKVYRSMNKPNQEELTKLVADLNKFYP